MNDNHNVSKVADEMSAPAKKPYDQPELRIYGKIQELTRNDIASSGEGGSGMGMA